MTKISIDEPLKTYLADGATQSAVVLLLKNSSKQRVGIEERSDYFNQSEYKAVWLAAREIYIEWHTLLTKVWEQVWRETPEWKEAGLRRLSSMDVKRVGLELPTMAVAWNEEWYGEIFETAKGKTIGLYVYANLDRVHLNYYAPWLQLTIEGWEADDKDFDSENEASWGADHIELSSLQSAATNLLTALSTE